MSESTMQGEQAAVEEAQPEPREPQVDEIGMNLTANDGNQYSIGARLIDGNAEEVRITDASGSTVILPSNVLGQLIAGVGTQESMIRNAIQREQMGKFGGQNMMYPGALAGVQQRVF